MAATSQTCEKLAITCTGGYLRPAGHREWCCTAVPGSALCRRHSLGCAFCPPSDTVPPSSAGPFHRSASTARAQDSSKTLSQTHEICIVVKKLTAFSSLCGGCQWPLTALHSVVNHCGRHTSISHACTAAGLSRCAHSLVGATLKSVPLF